MLGEAVDVQSTSKLATVTSEVHPSPQDYCQNQISLPDSQVVTSIHDQPPLPKLTWTLSSGLSSKINKGGIISIDFSKLPCKCWCKGRCLYNSNCRTKTVVYKATCLTTSCIYTGNTQQNSKKGCTQHLQEMKTLLSLVNVQICVLLTLLLSFHQACHGNRWVVKIDWLLQRNKK